MFFKSLVVNSKRFLKSICKELLFVKYSLLIAMLTVLIAQG